MEADASQEHTHARILSDNSSESQNYERHIHNKTEDLRIYSRCRCLMYLRTEYLILLVRWLWCGFNSGIPDNSFEPFLLVFRAF